jgi:hypothetical protein
MSNRFARPSNFGHPIRNPLLRRHYVYRAYATNGDLLYVGCTLDPEKRMATHRGTGDWYPHMARLELRGPFRCVGGRQARRRLLLGACGMTPAEYGEHLADLEPPISDAQAEAAARILAIELEAAA